MIILKSNREIEIMREAGKIVAEAHNQIKEKIRPGITTLELDEIAEKTILKHKAIPGFKGYGGFPNTICSSVNHEIIHGIPSNKVLKEGDIISVDIGSIYEGYYGDSAKTYGIGNISEEDEKLIRVTRESFYEGIKYAKLGYRLSDISNAIQKHLESNGLHVVKDYVGHGIGKNMHEDPPIPNYGLPGKGPRLEKGMVLAIEPMANIGTSKTKVLSDEWTVVTIDESKSAHYEHTIAITDDEPDILTLL